MARILTIGYSGRDIETFMGLLAANMVDVVCDVRSTPYSGYKPEFSRGALRTHLHGGFVKYVFLGAALGARPADRNCYVDGQATYDRIAATPAFQKSLDRIRSGSARQNLALVCSEADPIECHRAVLVCRHLDDVRDRIFHILADGRLESQGDFEGRLVAFRGLTPPPLLCGPGDWERAVSTAYDRQGDAIAYRERWPGDIA